MNEDHVIAAILAAGLISKSESTTTTPKEAVAIYAQCLAEMLEANRPTRGVPPSVESK